MTADMLSGKEESVHDNSGYLRVKKREDAVLRNKSGKSIRYMIAGLLSKKAFARSKAQIKRRKREKSSVRAKVEHVLTVQEEVPLPKGAIPWPAKTDR